MTPLILALALTAKAPAVADTTYSSVVVKPKQTISWIALRYLGGYSPAIYDTLAMDNPNVANLKRLKGGESIRLRRSMDRRKLTAERQIEIASRQAVVTTLRGEGEIRRADGATSPLAANIFLATGDEIRIGKGASAELVIDNQSVLRLRENSRLRIMGVQDASLANGRKAGTRVALDAGALWVKVRSWAGPLVGFEVRLPSVIAGVHGTVFETTVAADSTQTVAVREGVVSVTELREGGREIRLGQGQSVSVQPGKPLEPPAAAPRKNTLSPAPWPEEFQDPESPVETKVNSNETSTNDKNSAGSVNPKCHAEIPN